MWLIGLVILVPWLHLLASSLICQPKWTGATIPKLGLNIPKFSSLPTRTLCIRIMSDVHVILHYLMSSTRLELYKLLSRMNSLTVAFSEILPQIQIEKKKNILEGKSCRKVCFCLRITLTLVTEKKTISFRDRWIICFLETIETVAGRVFI